MPEVLINGPEGRLEGRYHHSKVANAPIALLLHPHPQHGGTMNNKVVYTLFQVFVNQGFSVLRFNFRGVGRSQGSFDRGEGAVRRGPTQPDRRKAEGRENARRCCRDERLSHNGGKRHEIDARPSDECGPRGIFAIK